MLPPAVAADEPASAPEEEEKAVEPETTEDEKPEAKLPYVIETTDGYADAEHKFDLVAVHGLNGSDKSWASKKEGSWLKDLAVQKSWETRVVRYSWDAEELKKDLYRRETITREAIKLLESVAELRKYQVQPLPLAFFGHDIGGIIIKEALFLAGQYENRFADIRCSTRVIAFFGVPNICKSFQHLEANVIRFLVTGTVGRRALQDARSLTKSIIGVNDSFLQTRMLTRATVFNGIAKDQTLADQVFDNSTTLFCTPYEVILEIKRPHKELIDEPGDSDDFHGLETLGMKRVATFPWRNDEISPFVSVIDSQAVPVYPLKTLCDVPHEFTWIAENTVFKEWRNNKNTAYLHIYGTLKASEVAQYGLQVVESGRDSLFEILYFKFDRYDARRNSIAAMANSFLSQVLSQCRDSPAALIKDLEPPDFSNCWTDQDAIIFLEKIRICLGNTGQVTWILDGLDQCDESKHSFLSQLLALPARSEQYFKVLFTSTDDKDLRETLVDYPAIDIREIKPPAGEEAPPPFELLTEVLQDQPHLSSIESSMRDLIRSCDDDDALCHILLEWFRGSRLVTKRAMEEEIKLLSPPTPEKVFKRILESMPNERRPWARKVITWILRSVRPLTPGELGIALAMDEASDRSTLDLTAHLGIMEEMKECFGPLMVIQNGEVHLAHPSARQIFMQVDTSDESRPWYLLDTTEQDHNRIAEVCVYYLALPNVQTQMAAACKASPNGEPIFEGQPDLLSYAIQFWPEHFRLSPESHTGTQTSETIASFLADGKALQQWAVAAWYFSNPKMRSDRSFLSPLPILASLGLEKEVFDLINGSERHNDKLIVMALVEAARNGHTGVVLAILKSSSIDKSGYLDAMVAAARSAKFHVLRDILSHATEHFKDLQLHDILTSRVAFFGIHDVLESLIAAGARVNSTTQSECSPPLHCAVFRNNVPTVDILLKNGAEHSAPNTNWKDYSPIVVASKYGHATMIQKLLKAGASAESKDSDGIPAIWWAVVLGQHEAVQALIDAGADKSCVEVCLLSEHDIPIFVTVSGNSFYKVTKALLKHAVNPNVPRVKSIYPLYALGRAAKQGNIEMCRLLMEFEADTDGSDDDKPLVHAVMSGKRDVVELFLDKEADVDVLVDGEDFAQTPLIAAADLDFKELATLLLEKKAAIDKPLSNGVTALFRAARNGHVDMMKLLIAAGADLKTKAYEKKWGLLQIAHDKGVEVLKVLLDAGVDIDTTCIDGTALYLAAYNEHPEAVKLLVSRGANTEIRCGEQKLWDDGLTPLQATAALGYTEILRALLAGGADIESKTPKGSTPLMLAVSNNKEDCVKALIEYNLDLEAVNDSKNTAIHTAATDTALSIIQLLVNRGANIEHRGHSNYTFLGRSISNKKPEYVKYLLEKKAAINVVGGYRGGPMHIAAASGQLEIFKLLVSKGGDVNVPDPNISGTPLQAALYPDAGEVYSDPEIDRDGIVRYLLEEADADPNAHGGYFGSALNVASLGSHDAAQAHIQLLLDKGADVNYADPFGRRALHYACFRTLPQVRLLLDAGADITAKTKIGTSPLHVAVTSNHLDVLELVLSKTKHLINDPDIDGWTPLMWACRPADKWGSASSIDAAVIKLLLVAGADLWVRGKSEEREWSPLKLARYHGASAEVVKLLTPKGRKRSTRGEREGTPVKEGASIAGWDAKFHTSKRAQRTAGYCDVCLFGIFGQVHACTECLDAFYICFKCWSRKSVFHPQHDKWEIRGTEYVEEEGGEAESPDTSEHGESGMVVQVEDDDEEGDWSNDES